MTGVVARFALAGLVLLCAAQAGAQEAGESPDFDGVLAGDFLMIADTLSYEEASDTVVASGNVEVAQGGRVLRAATLSYRLREGVVTASGDVALLEPSGEVMFADSVELSGDLRSGVIRRLGLLLSDNSRLTAAGARRLDGNRTVMRKAVYSPCELCPENPARPPLWQLRAGTVVHDQGERSLTYYDTSLEVLGLPVLYTPYFRHPDPTVKRHTGFLTPVYRSSAALGAEAMVPYYWNIAPNRDATFSPRFTSDEGVVLAGQYRARTESGHYLLDASITHANTTAEEDRRLRGHLFGEGLFDIDAEARWGFDVEGALDDTYLARYDISSKDDLVSNLFAETYDRRSFMSANAYAFQSLRAGFQSDRSPIVLPLLDANLVSAPEYFGGYATLDGNLMVLERQDGMDSRRISLTGGWHRPMILEGGHLLRIDASLRGDFYHFRKPLAYAPSAAKEGSDTETRAVPQLSVEWRYPLITYIGSIRHLIEPIAQGVISPYGGNPDDIPNEDSLDLEFDHTNLFSTNRFTGFDRVESGRRVNYGVRLGFYGPDGGRASALFGQSARAKEDDLFESGSGLEHQLSDYVGRIFVQPSPLVDVSWRFRLDRRDFVARRNEIDLAAGPEWLRGQIGFADLDRQSGTTTEEFVGGREAVVGVSTTLLDTYSFAAQTRRDLKDNATIRWNLGLSYEDECVLVGTGVTRSFTRDRDVQPDTVLYFTVKLRPAG